VLHYRKNNAGFTLIEVLIALAILSIALTAIIKATSQTIKNTLYLQNKTIASWVGSQVMNEARLGLLQLPTAPDKLEETTQMLGQTWSWTAKFALTPNPNIKKIQVDVYGTSNESKMIGLESYVYAQPK